jgi:hypothetical protein
VSDPNLSPSFDETGQVDELALRRNRTRSEPEYSTEDDLGIENDLSPDDDDDFDTLGLSPYDDYDDAMIIDDPDVEPRLVTDEDEDEDDDDLIYDDDER